MAFNALRVVVTQPPNFKVLEFLPKSTIMCHASGVGLEVVLMKGGQPLAFFSKALKGRALMVIFSKRFFNYNCTDQLFKK